MILHLGILLAAGLYELAYSDPGTEALLDYQRRGTVLASHIVYGHTVGIFTTRAGRQCTFEVIVDQPTGCVIFARGCGLTGAPACP
jgi:hypothetical protein